MPAEVDNAEADKENHEGEDRAQPGTVTAEELPTLRQIEHEPIDDGCAQHVTAGEGVGAHVVTERGETVREALERPAGLDDGNEVFEQDLQSGREQNENRRKHGEQPKATKE